VFLQTNRVECMSYSNTTLFYLMVEMYLHLLLHKLQLHVSSLDNSHLQVVHESLETRRTKLSQTVHYHLTAPYFNFSLSFRF